MRLWFKMDTGFDNLDATGFLEIWQHFDADGEDTCDMKYVFVGPGVHLQLPDQGGYGHVSAGFWESFKFVCWKR